MPRFFDFDFGEDEELFLLDLQSRRGLVGGSNPMIVPQRIFVDVTNHSNSGVAETTLITALVVAGSLRATGDFLEFVAEFDLAANANSKTITYKFGGQALNGNPWNNTLGNIQLTIIGRVYRTSITGCRSYIAASLPFLAQSTPFTQFTDITVANMDSNALDFVVTAQGGASDDIIHRVSHMLLVA